MPTNYGVVDDRSNPTAQRDFGTIQTPSPPQAPSPQPSTLQKVGNFFSSVEKGAKVVVGAIGNLAEKSGETLGAEINLNKQANLQNHQTALISQEVQAASKLPTLEQRKKALAKIGPPTKYVQQADLSKVDEMYKSLGIEQTDNVFTQAKKVTEKVPILGGIVQGGVDLGNIAQAGYIEAKGAVTGKMSHSDLSKLDALAEQTGLSETYDTANLSSIRKAAPVILNAAFTAGILVDPLLAGKMGFISDLGAVSADAVAGATVKSVLPEGVTEVSEGVAKAVGDEIVTKGTGWQELLTKTKSGLQVLNSTASGRYLAKMTNAGIINSTISLVDTWSQAGNKDTPQSTTDYLKAAGMGFLQGVGLEAVAGSVGYIGEKAEGSSAIKEVNQTFGTDYSGEQGAEIARVTKEIKDTYSGVLVNSRLQLAESDYQSALKDVEDSNISSQKQKEAQGNLKNWNRNYTTQVKETPVFGSVDESVAHMQENHGLEVKVADPSENTPSSMKATKDGKYQVTIQKGNLTDFWQQTGKAMAQWAKNRGISLRYFDSELDQIPDSGVKEMDTREAKFARIVQGIQSKSAEYHRETYPNIANLADSFSGVIKEVTPGDAARAFNRDNLQNLGVHYDEVDQAIQKEATTPVPDPLTGSTSLKFDQSKYDKLHLDLQDLFIKGKSKSQVVQAVRETIDKSNQVTSLRDAAYQAAQNNPALKSAVDSADKAFSSVKDLNKKIENWNQLLDTFGIPKPQTESPLEGYQPVTKESVLGGGQPSEESSPVQPATIPAEGNPGSAQTSAATEEGKKSAGETGEKGTSKLGKDIADTAVANKLATDFGSTAEYSKVDLKDQAARSNDLINQDYEKAIRVATGKEDSPEGLKPVSVLIAVERKATEEGDIAVLKQLASSDTVRGTSEAAQQLRILAERDPDSAVSAIQAVSDSRSKSFEQKSSTTSEKAISDTVQDIKKKITIPTKAKVSQFIDDITCK